MSTLLNLIIAVVVETISLQLGDEELLLTTVQARQQSVQMIASNGNSRFQFAK